MDDVRVAPSTLERARSTLLRLNVILLGVLAVTGLLLVVLYRPPPLPEPFLQRTEPNLAVAALSPLHRVAGLALLVSAAASLALQLVTRGRRAWAAVAGGLLAATAAAQASGGLLPWRLLLVWATAVEAGRGGFAGYLWAFGDDVRLAIVGNTEVAPGALLLRLGAHLASAALAGAAAWLLAAARRRR
jgi:quinol-cytochrome oxidoreductase complex cytochrome b subunit